MPPLRSRTSPPSGTLGAAWARDCRSPDAGRIRRDRGNGVVATGGNRENQQDSRNGRAHDGPLEQLDRVLASATFRGAERSSTPLRFLVEETVDGRAERLKEYTLGAEGLKRGDSFDPRTDPIVRAEASRLRSRLERYYATDGSTDPIVIVLPKGSYVPQFRTREIDAARGGATGAVGGTSSGERHRWPALAWFAVGAVVAIGSFVAGLWLATERTVVIPEVFSRFDVRLDTPGSLSSEVGAPVVLAPDGTRLVFVASGADGVTRLSTRLLSEAYTIELPGTEGARGPFFSPNGRWLGFWATGKLKKIAVDGGSPIVLCDAADLLGASWGDDGTIVATLNSTGTLWRVPANGGAPERVGEVRTDGASPRWRRQASAPSGFWRSHALTLSSANGQRLHEPPTRPLAASRSFIES